MSKNRSHSNYTKENPKMIDRGYGIKMTDEQWEYFMRPFNFFRNINKYQLIEEETEDHENY